MDLRIPSERQALPQDMTLEEVQKGGGGGECVMHGSRKLKSDFSQIMQNSAFDFICRPYNIAKLRCRLLLFSHPKILALQ